MLKVPQLQPPTIAISGSQQQFPVRRIFCVGPTYAEHVREMGNAPQRDLPFFFTNPADAVVSPAVDFLNGLGRATELANENDVLRRRLAQAQADALAGKEARATLSETQALLDLPQISDADGVAANVIDGATGNFERTFQIDKGSDAGIKRDMPVVVGAGLVGKIAAVSKSRATVLRIDDPSFGVGVQLLEPSAPGATGAVKGQVGSTFLKLSVFDSSAKITKDQIAVTRGSVGSLFPKGLAVGTVVRSVDPGAASTLEAELRTVVDLDRIDVVKVLNTPAGPIP